MDGVAGMAEGFRSIVNAWEGFHVVSEGFRELDGERVLVLVHATGSGKTSGASLGEVGAKAAELFHVRGGKVTRLVIYLNREDALADLGLSEPRRSRRLLSLRDTARAMSQENVEIVRASFEAWNAGDMDACVSCSTPTRCAASGGLAGAGPFVGREAVMRELEQSARPGTPTRWSRSAIHRRGRPSCREVPLAGAGHGPEANMSSRSSRRCARAGSSSLSTSGIRRRPSKPWAYRSKTLTQTPEPAGYWRCAPEHSRHVDRSRA